jgi:hypothetical protein
MKWLAVWLTFSCVGVPFLAYVCAHLREANCGQDYGDAEFTEMRRESRNEDHAESSARRKQNASEPSRNRAA